MLNKKMIELTKNGSAIRAMFEEGKALAKKIGKENVFDFSLGNPNLPAPTAVNEAIKDIVDNTDSVALHGYMSNSGFEDTRAKIATDINKKFGTKFGGDNIIMTVGAAGGLNVVLKCLLNIQDEVILFAPYFGEYNNYISNFDGKAVVVPANVPTFMPNLIQLEEKITAKTKAIIINSPNNPTGVIYGEEILKEISKILLRKQKELSTTIYIISDEPYRSLVYGDETVPYVTKFYANTIVGYSYSKSLSLAGERIGYIVVPDECAESQWLLEACSVATRILGFVNAPALQQKLIAKCLDVEVDISAYKRNRDILCDALASYGYEFNKPQGAFYLFVKSPTKDVKIFCEMAKKYGILMVNGNAFACDGYVRLAYCVAQKTIENSLPAFKKLAVELGLLGK